MKDQEIENEANVFALKLLMPEKFIKKDVEKGIDLNDEEAIKKLCKKYAVSTPMLIARITLLNLTP